MCPHVCSLLLSDLIITPYSNCVSHVLAILKYSPKLQVYVLPMNLVSKTTWPIDFPGCDAMAISRFSPYETGSFHFYVLGFWHLEPSHHAAHGVAHIKRIHDPQPSAPLTSQPTASTNLPATWMSHLGSGHSSPQVTTPAEMSSNCRLMSYYT